MSEETKMVLQMLRDGKISADEASNLLKALSGTPGRAEEPDHIHRDDVREAARLARQQAKVASRALREELRQVKHTSREAIRETKERLREEKEALREKLPESRDMDSEARGEDSPGVMNSLGALLGGLWGATYTWEDTEKGRFQGADVYKITLHGVNGRVVVEPYAGDEWELTTTKNINASTEKEAKQLAPDLYTLIKTNTELSVVAKRLFGQSRTVHFRLRVPQGLRYLLDARSTNGSVHVGRLTATEVHASTTNGKVVVEASADEMRLHSTNGRVELFGAAAHTSCRTVNGRIVVENAEPKAGELDLNTVNGRIAISLKEREDLGIRFTGSTVSGGVSSKLSRQHILTDERRTVGRKLVVETRGDHKGYLNITAKSVHGPINISGM